MRYVWPAVTATDRLDCVAHESSLQPRLVRPEHAPEKICSAVSQPARLQRLTVIVPVPVAA